MKRLFLIALLLLSFTEFSNSAFIRNYPMTVTQPDGTNIDCFASGDEYYNFLHTRDGYVIMQGNDGYYYFAQKVGKELSVSAYRVLNNHPESLDIKKWLMPDESVIAENYQDFLRLKKIAEKKSKAQVTGTVKKGKINNMVVFVTFADQTEITTNASKYENLYNAVNEQSFRDYYLTASYNQFEVNTIFFPTPSNTIISYQDDYDRNYYRPFNPTSNPEGYSSKDERMRREGALLDNMIGYLNMDVPKTVSFDSDNDGNIDNITFIIKGGNDGWGDLLWPHRSWYSGSKQIRGRTVTDYNLIVSDYVESNYFGLGVLCHEFFHSMDAPDFYHYSYDGFVPAGRWDLMEQTSNPPQFMCNFLKYQYTGWIDSIPEISQPGEYSLKPVTSPTNSIYKIKIPNQLSEYLVLEYRKQEGFYDRYSIPGSGLLVYRIDNTLLEKGNSNGPPDEVYIFRPGGDVNKNGEIEKAHLSAETGRTMINDYTDPKLFLSKGGKTNVEIYDVSTCGAAISFKVSFTPRTVITVPTHGSNSVTVRPSFSWKSIYGVSKYQVQLALDSGFYNVVYDKIVSNDTAVTMESDIQSQTRYYLRVKCLGSKQSSEWSKFVQFSSGPAKIDEDLFDAENIEIMPNPVQSKLNVRINNNVNQNIDIMIYNMNGLKVARLLSCYLPEGLNELAFDLGNLKISDGTYMLVLSSNNRLSGKKISIVK